MKLNNRGFGLKEMIILSSILFIILLIMAYYILVLYHNLEKESVSQYTDLESQIKSAAIKYVNNYEHGSMVTLKELKEVDYIDVFSDSNDDSCSGYVIVSDGAYTPYIKCKSYTTKGYND